MHVQREREVYKLTTFQPASTPKDNEQESISGTCLYETGWNDK
jgi:hypothetical protein